MYQSRLWLSRGPDLALYTGGRGATDLVTIETRTLSRARLDSPRVGFVRARARLGAELHRLQIHYKARDYTTTRLPLLTAST
jgi:hypothetical protein